MSVEDRIAALESEISALRAELRRTRSEVREPHETIDQDPRGPVTRRALLRGVGAAAAAGVGGAVLAASPSAAGVDGDVVLGAANIASSLTSLSRTHATDSTLAILNASTGAAISASSFGSGDDPATIAAENSFGIAIDGTGVSSNVIGVRGKSVSGIGVRGQSSSGPGLSGASVSSSGVVGGSTSGDGVYGYSISSTSVVADAPTANTAGTQLQLVPGSIATAPTGGAHSLGQLWVDSTGALHQCVVAGTPGTWVKHAPLVTLAAPFRVYDSRVGQPNPSGATQGPLAFGGGTRTISCNPGAQIPGARTILFNLTVTGTAGASAGALLVWAAGVSEPLASSINWSAAGQTLANAVTSGCNASQQVQVKCVASAGSSTQFLLDIIGYYR